MSNAAILTQQVHWAAHVIDKPWRPGATGPDAFYCWGLVQWVCATRQNRNMQTVELKNDGNHAETIRRLAKQYDYHVVPAPAEEYDIVIMRAPFNQRHVGIMVRANGTLGVLHADGRMTDEGPTGAVVFERLVDLRLRGLGMYELWRAA